MKTTSPTDALKWSQLSTPKPTKQVSESDEDLKKVSAEFEALFVNQMLQQMRKASVESELIQKSEGEKVFQGMLDQEYAQSAAQRGAFHLGQSIYEQLKPHVSSETQPNIDKQG